MFHLRPPLVFTHEKQVDIVSGVIFLSDPLCRDVRRNSGPEALKVAVVKYQVANREFKFCSRSFMP